MSYYSDWKCGAISDNEYSYLCSREDKIDKAMYEKEDFSDENCEYYHEGCCEFNGQLCNGCE